MKDKNGIEIKCENCNEDAQRHCANWNPKNGKHFNIPPQVVDDVLNQAINKICEDKALTPQECEVCDSQIYFDTNITKDELIEWIKMNLKFIKHIKNI